jgi:hypothetical protein
MSAFQCSTKHLAAIEALFKDGPIDCSKPAHWRVYARRVFSGSDMQEMLWNENAKSVASRYRDAPPEPFPGRGQAAQRPTIVEGLKLIACYEYQSCEHDGWEQSNARQLCRELRSELIHALPGYDEAPWGLA